MRNELAKFLILLALATAAPCMGCGEPASTPPGPDPTVGTTPPEPNVPNVDPCADTELTTSQLFPKELVEDGEGPLIYDEERDWLVLGLGTRVLFREGGGTWQVFKDLYTPVSDMELDSGRGRLYVLSKGYGATGNPFFILADLNLSTRVFSYVTPPGLDSFECQNADLALNEDTGEIFLACNQEVWRRAPAGAWSVIAKNEDVGGNHFVSVVAATKSDGTSFVCAGTLTPSLLPPPSDGVFCREGSAGWVMISNDAWHSSFKDFVRHRLLFNPLTSEILSVVRDQDPRVLVGQPSGSWEELFSLTAPHLPSEAVLDPTTGRVYVTDESCTLSYFDDQLTEIGSLGAPLETFGPSRCPGRLALDTAHATLYTPLYENPCLNSDGFCPRLVDIVGVCLPQ